MTICTFSVLFLSVALLGAPDRNSQLPTDEHGVRSALYFAQQPNENAPPMGGIAGAAADWQPLGPFGGDVQVVAVSPTNSQIVLAGIAPAGSTGGTLYRSTDGGSTWVEVAQLAGNSVFDAAFAPDGTAYIGTFDSVWRSMADGANGTWTQFNLGIGLNDQTFAVTIDPNNPSNLWAGIADAIGSQPNNIMRSTDGGASWFNATPPLASPMSGRGIAINPNDSNEVMVVFGGGFGGGQVWFSGSGGAPGTWVNRSAGLPNNPMNVVVHDGTRFLVGGGQAFGSQFVGLYATTDNGVTWTQLHDGTWPSLVVTDISIDPNDAQTILASTHQGVNRSTAGGAPGTWTTGVPGTPAASLNSVHYAPGSSSVVFAGGSSVGVLRSNNGGQSFTHSSNGIGALVVYSVASNPNNPNDMALAFQGLNNGGVYSSTDGGVTWTLEEALPPTRYNTVRYAPDGRLHAISDGPTTIGHEALYRREFDGSWTYLGPNQGPAFEARLWSVRFSDNDPDLIFLGGRDFGPVFGHDATIWRSNDAGTTWQKVYESGVNFEAVRDIEIVEDGTDQTILAAYEDTSAAQTGGLLRSTDGGTNWSLSVSGLPAGTQAMSLAALPMQPETFFLASRFNADGGVFRSDDAGVNWTQAGYNLPTHGVVTDPADDQVIYIMRSANERVLRSTDQASSFHPFNDGLGNPGTARDLFHTGGNQPRLLLATATGVYATDLPAPCKFADLDCDGVVGVSDLLILLASWGVCPDCDDCPADLDGSCNVGVNDLLLLLSNWG